MNSFSFRDAIQFLDNLLDNERIKRPSYPFDLEAYRNFLASFGNPEKRLKNTILIAGTKGKGSTATLIASGLQSIGHKVGLYTSPHLMNIRERISINGYPIPEEKFTQYMERIIPQIESRITNHESPNYRTVFEILTTIAFLHFLEEEVDYTVLEVGLGGRLDATNVVNPLISVITSLSLDHMDILGGTLQEIAREKAGIIRENGVVVSAPQKEEALGVLEEVCRERRARLILVVREIHYEILERNLKGTRFRVTKSDLPCFPGRQAAGRHESRITSSEFFLPLLGDHQVENAATALGALSVLGVPFDHSSNNHLTVSLRGRLEIVGEKPWIVLDCAHNPYSAECLKNSIESLFPHKKIILLCSILGNKDYEGIARVLSPLASEVILTRTNSPRTAPLSILKEKFEMVEQASLPVVHLCEETDRAFTMARRMAKEDDVILVTGSMYLVGDVLKILQNEN